MEVISNKRPADNEESGPMESVALCHSCNRMTHNLKICENCNSSLSESNSSSCYGSEPKRSRLDSASLSAAPETSVVMETTNSAPEMESTSSTSTVRPETLFVNVHNHAVPLSSTTDAPCPQPILLPGPVAQTVSNTVAASDSLPILRPRVSVPSSHMTTTSNHLENATSVNGNGISSRPVLGTVTLNSRVAVDAVTGSNTLGQPRSLGHLDAYSNRPTATAAITLPTYNLQPPPPPFASSVARLPVAVANSSVPNVVPLTGSAPSQNVSVSAIQIRIGSKKFKPISPVTFKDDGILFTLKDFTYAPVLLNARAIVKCKANLNTFSYPALFLFLENSCMRQIRQIFGLNASEFMANSDVEIKRCISIFPIFGIEGKQQVQQLTFSIKRSFEAMVKRYPRSSAILEEITNDAVINILLEAASGSDASAEANNTASSSTTSTAPTSTVRVQSTIAASTAMSSRSQLPTLSTSSSFSQANGVFSSVTERSVPPQLSVETSSTANTGLANRVIARGAPVAASTSSTTSAPILVMPSDASRWQTMTKGLVVGGVYHVQTLDKQKRYCLWNGTQLVPCFVQNTEVSISCSQIRIGVMTAQCIGEVRIKVEGASGVYFTMKYENCGIQEVYVALTDMAGFSICISRMTVVFIALNAVGAEKLNFKVKSLNKDPVLNVNSIDMMKKYILIFVPMLNHDQEEALRHMSFPSSASTLSALTVLDHSTGLNILAGIRCHSSLPPTIAEYLNANKLSGASGFDRLANEIIDLVNLEPDDDDDVIMTQEEIGIKCPYTQKVMIQPVQNKHCGHNYEKNGIQEFMLRKKGNAKCPYAGCGNMVPVRMEDLTDNVTLKDYISKLANKSNNQLT